MTFFGPDLRNGLPIGLGSVAGFGIAPQFSPASLFLGGTVNGAWYDPSDSTTLFTDRAGTTPCGTPGGGSVVPVGLMLDKSQGLVLGSETVTNGDFSGGTTTGWTATSAALSVVGGQLSVVPSTTFGYAYQTLTTVVGTTYRLTFSFDQSTAAIARYFVGTSLGGGEIVALTTVSGVGSVSRYFTATTTTTFIHFGAQNSSGLQALFDNISVRALAGNHAIAANDTTARPELRARVNLLTYSTLQGGGAAPTGWTQPVATGTSAPSGTAANGDIIYTQSATAQRPFLQQSVVLDINVQYRLSFSVTAATGLLYQDIIGLNTVEPISYFLNGVSVSSTATVSPGTVSITWTSAGGTTGLRIGTGVFGNATGSLTFSSPDLRPTNIGTAMPAYQRISDANTYDAVGFPRYLACNGTSSAMSTPGNVNLSGTDKATVFVGVRKLGTSIGVIIEAMPAYNQPGGMAIFANTVASNDYGAALQNGYITGTAYTPPITNVVTASFDIAAATLATEITMRVNGATPTTATTGSASTGNFGNLPYSIGVRNLTTVFFNGNIYSIIVVGSAVSAGQISATEQWVAGKTGITI